MTTNTTTAPLDDENSDDERRSPASSSPSQPTDSDTPRHEEWTTGPRTAPLPESGLFDQDEPQWWPEDIIPQRIVKIEPRADGTEPPESLRTIRIDPAREELGHGASATVRMGVAADGTRVAVKRFHALQDAEERAKSEWRGAQKVHGPYVVRALACYCVVSEADAAAWVLVLELAEGGDMSRVLTRVADGEVVDHDTQHRWLRSGLTGLAELAEHSHQLRDIKPDNIGLTSTGWASADPVFLDHGIAQWLGTKTKPLAGTPAYSAPELRTGRPPITPLVDVFSFGASLIEVFTGGEGFDPADPEWRTLTARPHLDDPRLAPEVAAILRGMLVKLPDDRPSAAELLDCLDGRTPVGDWDADSPYPLLSQRSDFRAQPEEEFVDLDAGLDNRPAPVTVLDPTVQLRREPVQLLSLDVDPELLEIPDVEPRPRVRGRLLERFAGVDPTFVTTRGGRTVYNVLGLLLAVYFIYAVAAMSQLIRMTLEAQGLTVDGVVTAISLAVGLLIAVVVVSWDRSIVALPSADLRTVADPASDSKPLRTLKASMFFRVLFAVLFALLVGQAANQFLFAGDVQQYLAETADTSLTENSDEIRARYQPQLEAQDAIITAAEAAKIERQSAIDTLFAQAAGEDAGTFGTGEPGCEDECRRYLGDAQALQNSQAQLVADQDAIIKTANDAKADIQDTIDKAIEDEEDRLAQNTGLIAREDALFAMLWADPGMMAKYVVLTALLLLLELSAVIIKLSTRGNNYELKYARELRHLEHNNLLRSSSRRAIAIRRAQDNEALLAEADRRFYRSQRQRS